MAKNPLFSDGDAPSISYRNVRAANNEFMERARKHCEVLWESYEPCADREFRTEIKTNFDARYWEMYLTVCLMGLGYEVASPKPGPDVGILVDGLRIWFEATSPEPGANDNPDRVPELKFSKIGEEPIVQNVPNEQMILRYLNSISDKCKRQYPSWIEQGVVSSKDAFVIAINPKRLGHEFGDTRPPRILQAAFPIGAPYAVLDSKTAEIVDQGNRFRNVIKKNKGEPVTTGIFLEEDYVILSGLLCSRVDAANHPTIMGADFQLVPNPNARVRLPEKFRLKGTYYKSESKNDQYEIIPELNE